MKTIVNPFLRKICRLDSFDKIQQNIKDYYKKWLALVKVYDPDAGNCQKKRKRNGFGRKVDLND